ncbi:hypothetical protein [Aquisalimonas asiatica]|uniref:hypothetical protein n=1 Tax=Aquisalimonas asiatica TaxID=406100 RepID=UPI0011142661|nr:hypothetical protein [Aquisalimonas asiatica]
MSVRDYEERPFVVAVDANGADDCGIEPNPSDGGRTETAWVKLVDDETGTLWAMASVQVYERPIPYTDHEERIFSEDDVSIELFEVEDSETVPPRIVEKLLEDTNAVEILRHVCREADQEDHSL